MPSALLSILLATAPLLAFNASQTLVEPDGVVAEVATEPGKFNTPRELLTDRKSVV